MIIHKGYENLDLATPVVTLGIFDGVHKGHRTLLDRLVSRAKEVNGESVVITFFPHPRLVLDKNKTDLSFLSTMEEKVLLIENANIDNLIIIEFNKEFSRIPACTFVKEILIEKIGTKHLLVGYDHHFGRNGEGDFNTIKQCTSMNDFHVEQLQGFHSEEGNISSSSIRQALLTGNLDAANNWLGYSYSLSGTIIKGRQIGRSIGFPTANIRPDDKYKLIPVNGIYAVEVVLDRKIYLGMMSIGTNPTVNKDRGINSIEVHILDFEGDIYEKPISVIFRKRLRDEIKFDNTMQLAEQINIDRQQVIHLLK
jgi:riboflavin kinase / FMN adenylyltransferase